MQKEYVQVVTTVTSQEDGQTLARHLVDQRLAACVQVGGPITSFYRWRDELEQEEEFQVLAKSRRDLSLSLVDEIRKKHPYETPEILVLPIITGNSDYLSWLDGELRTTP